ncbi:MAG: hypothetical protein R2712_14515 [Vicinamibacterales bacterium]
MQEHTYAAHNGCNVTLDLCMPCQSLWFDLRESLALTPASTLAPSFRDRRADDAAGRHRRGPGQVPALQGPAAAHPGPAEEHALRVPAVSQRARALRRASSKFPKEKEFVRTLTASQIAELRQSVQTVNCSNWWRAGEPGGVWHLLARSPSMLDMGQAGRLIAQLQAADKSNQPVDPALPLNLERARRRPSPRSKD